MLNSDQVFAAIEQIAQTSSTTAKRGLVRAGMDDELFVRVIKAAVDPFITYGIAKVPKELVSEDPDARGLQFDESTWLMLDQLAARKLTGNEARRTVACELGELTEESAQLLTRILKKDLRAGFGATLVNAVCPGAVPVFEVMLAHPFDVKRVKSWPVAVEPKLDGVRVVALIDTKAGTVRFVSRSGKEFTTFSHLERHVLEAAKRLDIDGFDHRMVFDGEVVSGTFNKTVSEVRKKNEACLDAEYHVFEVLPASLFEGALCHTDYTYRRLRLEFPDGGPIKKLPSHLAYSEAEIHAKYDEFRAQGLEGVIVKWLDGKYELKRSHAWGKIKAEESVDAPIVDAFEGTGKYEGKLGGLVIEHEGIRVNVGSGFSDQQREEFWELYDEDLQRRSECSERGEDAVDTLLGRVVEIQYHEVLATGSLRHPRFLRFRDDKRI